MGPAGFDLDTRIRPRADGRYVLPAPFDQQDAAIEVGTLGECSEGYLFCDVSCEGEGASTLDAMMESRRQQVSSLGG